LSLHSFYTISTSIYTLSLHDALPICQDVRNRLDELDRHHADKGQRRPLKAGLDYVGEREEEARAERRPWTPLPEDEGGQGEIALARRHVPDERRVVGDRQVRPRHAAQHAAHGERAVPW